MDTSKHKYNTSIPIAKFHCLAPPSVDLKLFPLFSSPTQGGSEACGVATGWKDGYRLEFSARTDEILNKHETHMDTNTCPPRGVCWVLGALTASSLLDYTQRSQVLTLGILVSPSGGRT